jgi:hypothetical protein
MIGAGTIISPIIKVVTTVAILAAVYFFIVKPTLDTTESISGDINNSINESFETFSPDVQQSIRQARKLQNKANNTGQAQLADANKLLDCIQDADSDVDKITACNEKFSP